MINSYCYSSYWLIILLQNEGIKISPVAIYGFYVTQMMSTYKKFERIIVKLQNEILIKF